MFSIKNLGLLLATFSVGLLFSVHVVTVHSEDIPNPLPDPSDELPDESKPVKVYILMGQSNMVGMGDITGGFSRWGEQFTEPVVSVYAGEYDPNANYDQLEPIATQPLPKFGGVEPTPFPGGGTHVVRGFVEMPESGVYEFKPGYGGSTYNIMRIEGEEVYRREVGDDPEITGIQMEAGRRYQFMVTFFTDDANGLGWAGRVDIPGTLATLVKEQGYFPYLIDDEGDWTVRNDVIYKGVVSAVGQGPLTVGIQGNTIGPETGFGHVLGYYHDEPVVIIKASIGNRSLGWDILPPGSPRFTYEGRTYAAYGETPDSWIEGEPKREVDWYAGKQYDEFVAATKAVLDEFDTNFPDYASQGYEVSGFAWWQGHKDGNDAHASRYEDNLVRLIHSLRHEFDAPNAPFVISTIGFEGWDMSEPHLTVAEAQLAVSGETGNYPEFEGNVLTVESRDFWREVDQSPRNQGYHYNRNAETYMLVGEALGRGMVKLLSDD